MRLVAEIISKNFLRFFASELVKAAALGSSIDRLADQAWRKKRFYEIMLKQYRAPYLGSVDISTSRSHVEC